MLQYLIILLDDASTSYCHYQNTKAERKLIPLEALKRGIVWAMKENLNIQFVYPDYPLPQEYLEAIDSIDHSNIKPICLAEDADVVVVNDWAEAEKDVHESAACIIRTKREDLQSNIDKLDGIIDKAQRLNIVFTDAEQFSDEDIESYQSLLEKLTELLQAQYKQGRAVQLNLLTDRMMLERMNNCGAGDTNVTLAPNGRFYVCPACYYEDENISVGDLQHGLNIPNKQLLQLDHAPLCRRCDAYQCKRCIWMNERLTLDANTPSHQQCVMAHLERNASRQFMKKLEKDGIRLSNAREITEIDYLDPFNKYNRWK